MAPPNLPAPGVVLDNEQSIGHQIQRFLIGTFRPIAHGFYMMKRNNLIKLWQ